MAMLTPLFSVIIPVYNDAAKLPETLESVLSQEEPLREIIVIDGGSRDGTQDVLAAYGERLAWVSEPDDGIYDAMNKGIRRARGRYLYFLGAGDTLRPGILAHLAPLLPAATEARPAIIYGNVRMGPDGSIHNGPHSKWKLTRGNLCHQSVFYSREIFARFGPMETRYPLYGDYVLNMRCFGDPCVMRRYIHVVVADYDGTGASATGQDAPFARDRLALARQYLGFWPSVLFRWELSLTPAARQRRVRAIQTLKRLLGRRPVPPT